MPEVCGIKTQSQFSLIMKCLEEIEIVEETNWSWQNKSQNLGQKRRRPARGLKIYQQRIQMNQQRKNNKLFTLNESITGASKELRFDDYVKSEESSLFQQQSELGTVDEQEHYKQENERLSEQLEQCRRSMGELRLKNKELQDSLDISQLKIATHEEKQRELIKKLSHEQVGNRQLQFEIRRMNEQMGRAKENSALNDQRKNEAQNIFRKAQKQRALFIQSFRKIAEAISKCQKAEEFESSTGKFLEFIRKNIEGYQNSDPNGSFQFELKFELSQASVLKNKISELESRANKLKEELDRQRVEKRRIVSTYNQKLAKLKQQCDSLRAKVEQKQSETQFEISSLKKALNEKNEVISELKQKMNSENKRKESFCSKKSKNSRHFYIGDGERQGNIEMTEIENQIEQLERLLIEELRD